ncbi:MAG: Uma2 family endonuclease [Chloroflexi bacterium]|nr:MAG: Uma2 family endonuclease [Chloroflexota bacterium]
MSDESIRVPPKGPATVSQGPSEPPLATEIAALFPPQGQWTEEDYFALPDTQRYVELSDGELVMPPHPTNTHQMVVGRLAWWLGAFVRERRLGLVRLAPLPVRLWPGKIREPDVLFMAREHYDRVGEQAFGPPDLVIEVTSPATRRVDRTIKFVEYAQAGISEYWIVDPEAKSIEVFVLREGAYELLGKWGPGETAHSALLEGFQVDIAALFAPEP